MVRAGGTQEAVVPCAHADPVPIRDPPAQAVPEGGVIPVHPGGERASCSPWRLRNGGSMENRTLTGIRGLSVGHWTDPVNRTGCTVVLGPPEGFVASAVFGGASPGTREAVLLAPEKRIDRIHAITLCGGSAFGLEAAHGVVRFLAERGIGHPTRTRPVPLVPAAVIYDFLVGSSEVWPTVDDGYRAAGIAESAPVARGRVGAGGGASAGKYREPVPTGLGSSLARFDGDEGSVRVGALAVVNPVGDVWDRRGRLRAGHGDLEAAMRATVGFGNTTLLVIGVEARLPSVALNRVARTALVALGRVVRPGPTPWDGDAAFVISTGRAPPAPEAMVGALAAEAVVDAVIDSTRPPPKTAAPAGG